MAKQHHALEIIIQQKKSKYCQLQFILVEVHVNLQLRRCQISLKSNELLTTSKEINLTTSKEIIEVLRRDLEKYVQL